LQRGILGQNAPKTLSSAIGRFNAPILYVSVSCTICVNKALRLVVALTDKRLVKDNSSQLVWHVLRTPEYRAVIVSKRERPKDMPPSFVKKKNHSLQIGAKPKDVLPVPKYVRCSRAHIVAQYVWCLVAKQGAAMMHIAHSWKRVRGEGKLKWKYSDKWRR
jgi:hypothetical protein